MSEPRPSFRSGADADEPFYVGYLPVPRAIRRWVTLAAAVLLGVGIGAALLVASQQADPGDGIWNTDEVTRLKGQLLVDPYPLLIVSGDDTPPRTVLLVSMLKQGAAERAAAVGASSRQWVEVSGHAIRRDGQSMLELVDLDEAFRVVDSLASRATPVFESLGSAELVGQIIDPKCYFGVMKPGVGKIHRACAVRCIDGGIPPVLMTRHDPDPPSYYLLTDEEGGSANQSVLDHVAEVVRVSGTVERRAGMLYLRADVEGIERVQ